jgi:hypothetical protein
MMVLCRTVLADIPASRFRWTTLSFRSLIGRASSVRPSKCLEKRLVYAIAGTPASGGQATLRESGERAGFRRLFAAGDYQRHTHYELHLSHSILQVRQALASIIDDSSSSD